MVFFFELCGQCGGILDVSVEHGLDVGVCTCGEPPGSRNRELSLAPSPYAPVLLRSAHRPRVPEPPLTMATTTPPLEDALRHLCLTEPSHATIQSSSLQSVVGSTLVNLREIAQNRVVIDRMDTDTDNIQLECSNEFIEHGEIGLEIVTPTSQMFYVRCSCMHRFSLLADSQNGVFGSSVSGSGEGEETRVLNFQRVVGNIGDNVPTGDITIKKWGDGNIWIITLSCPCGTKYEVLWVTGPGSCRFFYGM